LAISGETGAIPPFKGNLIAIKEQVSPAVFNDRVMDEQIPRLGMTIGISGKTGAIPPFKGNLIAIKKQVSPGLSLLTR
jgi:hypothetical protein